MKGVLLGGRIVSGVKSGVLRMRESCYWVLRIYVDVTEKDNAKSRFDSKRELRGFGVKSWKEKKMYCCIVKEMMETTDREHSWDLEVRFESSKRDSLNYHVQVKSKRQETTYASID